MKILYFPENASLFSTILVFNYLEVSTAKLCYTVTCNSPGHGIKRPLKYLFSMKFTSGW